MSWPPNNKMQLTIAKATRLAAPSLTSSAIAADLWRYVHLDIPLD